MFLMFKNRWLKIGRLKDWFFSVHSCAREAQEGGDMRIYACIRLIHFVVQHKLTQYCEAIILQ